jgi:DNA polymerase I-like protein with 3'-5' exonuclease and polymerase domains
MTDNWRTPTELPDLRRVGIIALDTETCDERLRADMGSGWPFRSGRLCGISIAHRAESGARGFYFPLRHPDSENFAPEQVYRWVCDHIAAHVHFITQNGLYDWGWLRAEAGIKMPPGECIEEIGALATMIDENRYQYGLDALCAWRGLPGKDDTLLRQGIEALGLINNKRKKVVPQNYLWQLPARYVGPYAEADAVSTFLLQEELSPILDREGTRAAYRLECDILPMVLEMRLCGIRIDLDAAEKARDQLLHKRDAALAELSEKLGCAISMHEIQGRQWLTQTFDRLNIKYPHTEKGNPSFTAGKTGWMAGHTHWLPPLIATANKYNKAVADFVQKLIDYSVKQRIHAEINPHRSEDNGTKSFRFSYNDPPLQQMPSRDEELAPLIRGLFLPEEGEFWLKPDCSQQEFRLVVHYANQHKVRAAAEAVARYRDDPAADFHAFAATLTGLDRTSAKAVNFAKIYGAGVKKFAQMIGKPLQEAQRLYAQYDRELPFLRQLSNIYIGRARSQGYITLYDGARRHFDRFAPGGKWQKGAGPCSLEEARERLKDPEHPWYRGGALYRADTHTALNALIQGSAARHTKLWMRACWRAGIVPLLQMHDCLDCSVSSREQAELIARLGEEAVQLDVPMRVDLKFGRNWGDAKHTWDQLCNGAEIRDAIFAGHLGSNSSAKITNPRPSHEVAPKDDHRSSVENPAKSENSDYFGKRECPFHKDPTPSLHLYPDGHYHCYGCGAHGDIEELPETVQASAPSATHSNTNTLKLGLRLWRVAVSIRGTLAEQYLRETRELDLAALPDINAVLRFHPRCPFDGNNHPCVIALFRDVETDESAGIHRVALTANAEKIGRMMLGSWPRPRAIKLRLGNDQLVAGEGIETVIAGAMRRADKSSTLWAMGSAGAIGKLPLVPGFVGLTILVDREASNIGLDNARACTERWRRAGRKTGLAIPHQTEADFNDLIKGKMP